MIRIGSCSWAEKSLIRSGEFYPKGMKSAEERLRYYTDQLSTVEVDSSFYAIPDRGSAALWAARTPDGFIFHVKAFAELTGHGADPKTLPKDILCILRPAPSEVKLFSAQRYYLSSPTLQSVVNVHPRRRSFSSPI